MNSNPKIVVTVVMCITFVTVAALALGAWLTSKGYQGGEIMLTTGASGLGGLIAMLSSTRASTPTDVNVTNPPTNPVQTQETH